MTQTRNGVDDQEGARCCDTGDGSATGVGGGGRYHVSECESERWKGGTEVADDRMRWTRYID